MNGTMHQPSSQPVRRLVSKMYTTRRYGLVEDKFQLAQFRSGRKVVGCSLVLVLTVIPSPNPERRRAEKEAVVENNAVPVKNATNLECMPI